MKKWVIFCNFDYGERDSLSEQKKHIPVFLSVLHNFKGINSNKDDMKEIIYHWVKVENICTIFLSVPNWLTLNHINLTEFTVQLFGPQ